MMNTKVELLKVVMTKDQKIASPKLLKIIDTINDLILAKEKNEVKLYGEIENLKAQLSGLKIEVQKLKGDCNVE